MARTLQEYIQRVLADEGTEKVSSKQDLVEAREDAESEAFSEAIDQHPIGRPMPTRAHR